MRQHLQNLLKTPFKIMVLKAIDWRLWLASKPLQPTAKTAMVFAPHQDDESFGCGAMIALKRSLGAAVRVVFLTDGGRSYGWELLGSEKLAEKRRIEALEALATLGVASQAVSFLNQPDGGLADLTGGDRQALITRLVDLLKDTEPEEVYVTYRQDNHPDHEEAYRLVQAAIGQAGLSVQLMEYPIWSLYKPLKLNFKADEFKSLYRLPIQTVRGKKLRAISCHRSQYEPLPPDTRGGLPQGFVERLSSPYEFFFVSSSAGS